MLWLQVAETFSCGSANPAKAVLRGKNAAVDNMVIYPPRLVYNKMSKWLIGIFDIFYI